MYNKQLVRNMWNAVCSIAGCNNCPFRTLCMKNNLNRNVEERYKGFYDGINKQATKKFLIEHEMFEPYQKLFNQIDFK